MTRCRIPFGLLGMLALVAAVEASLFSREPTSLLPDIWADAYARADSDEVRASTVLCLGDSQIKLGINAAALGAPAYNLALHAGQPAAAEALLRRALDAGARPRTVILGFDPSVLDYPASTNVRQWPEVLGPAECLALAIEAGDSRLAAVTLLSEILPSTKARDELRRAIRAAIRGEPDPGVVEMARGRRDRAEARGSVVAPVDPTFTDPPAPTTGRSAWRPRRENERAIGRLLALAESRQISAAWVTPTLSPAEQSRRARSGLEAAYRRFLRGLQAEFPGLIVLETAGLNLNRTVFRDPIHLDGRGSAALTASVARAMVTGRSRWVVLATTAGVTR